MLDGAKIFITGGTGSFGTAMTNRLLETYPKCEIVIFSRDEMKQWQMQKSFENEQRLSFILGDVRDLSILKKSVRGSDFIFHAAATKIVPLAELNPSDCIKTNILGALNVVEAADTAGVRKVVALSTDKASSPVNLYGASKLASDKIFSASNFNHLSSQCKFSIVRYGNVVGSRGSVVPFFRSLAESKAFPITDKRMTRFMITLDQAIDLVLLALNDMVGGEIYVKKIPSMNIMDIADTIDSKREKEEIGVRPGEKLHEQMIAVEDAPFTYEYDNYFKIIPESVSKVQLKAYIKNGVRVDEGFSYSSNTNEVWMTNEELREIILLNNL